MKKTWLELYALAVCFFTVACFVIVLGMAAWNTVSLAFPEFTLPTHEWQRHQSDEAFRGDSYGPMARPVTKEGTEEPLSGAELSAARERSYAQAIRSERRQAAQGLVRNLIILFIDILVFAGHWQVARRARESGEPRLPPS